MENGDILNSWIKYFKENAHKSGGNFSQKDLSVKTGLKQQYISQLINKKRTIGEKVLDKICRGLNITKAQFHLGPPPRNIPEFDGYHPGDIIPGLGTLEAFDPNDTIPLLTDIPAGHWKEWVDSYPPGQGEGKVPRYGLKGGHIFALRVSGDSMSPDIEDGDLLIVNPEKAFTNTKGGIGVVKSNGGYQVRRVYLRGDNYLLEPSNKHYEAEIVPVTGTTVFKIVEWRPKREGMF